MKTASVFFDLGELKEIIRRHMSEVYNQHQLNDDDISFNVDHDTGVLTGVNVSVKLEPKALGLGYMGR